MPAYKRPQIVVLVLILAAGITASVVNLARSRAAGSITGPVRLIEPNGGGVETVIAEEAPDDPPAFRIHVAGKVAKPGVYDLEPGTRVEDAIEAAGGATSGADLETINLAEKLSDGQQVYIALKGKTPAPATSVVRGGDPGPGGKPPAPSAGATAPASDKFKNPGDGVVSINSAGEQELEKLPGVGPAMSGRIIEYRREHGGFESVDELEEVKGIGPKTLEKMRPFVKL